MNESHTREMQCVLCSNGPTVDGMLLRDSKLLLELAGREHRMKDEERSFVVLTFLSDMLVRHGREEMLVRYTDVIVRIVETSAACIGCCFDHFAGCRRRSSRQRLVRHRTGLTLCFLDSAYRQ